ncbi:hypothetical protein DBR17_01675 [Sphingomonas sp. HMWF008]|nr:hypothetical protein DBR17_01675 [Sphingomonas sp. HMWF008]
MVDAVAQAKLLQPRVELAIGGKLYAGWTSVSVTRSLDTVSGTFELALTEKAKADDAPFPILPGDPCTLLIDGATVINGFVDLVAPSIGADDHSIMVSGRDRTADLADCSAIHKPGSWRNTKIEAIAAELAKPFGVRVSAKVSTGAVIPKFALQPGESVQAAIERLLRFRGLLMVANAEGDLDIITPEDGAPVAVLQYGANLLTGSARHDHRERFSAYRIKGQAAGDDTKSGKTVSQLSGSATDPGVTRYRPLLIVAEEQGDGASLATRAKWEAGVRAGKSIAADITVLGWQTAPGGALWRPNMPVRVVAAPLQLADRTMLVTAVTLTKDDAGTIATLTVMPPEAWKQLAEKAK